MDAKPTILRADIFDRFPEILFGMSTRLGGVSPEPLNMNLSYNVGDEPVNVEQNRELFFRELGVDANEVAFTKQVHSASVKSVEGPGVYEQHDALATGRRRVFVCVSVADCVPICVYDPRRHVVAAIHAGWRGTAGRIVENTMRHLMDEFNSEPKDLFAFIGPSAASCCYEVGEEVEKAIGERFIRRNGSLRYADLKQANFAQLVSMGLIPSQIEVSQLCTITESNLLHSYRRDKEKSGRMLAVIGLQQD